MKYRTIEIILDREEIKFNLHAPRDIDRVERKNPVPSDTYYHYPVTESVIDAATKLCEYRLNNLANIRAELFAEIEDTKSALTKFIENL